MYTFSIFVAFVYIFIRSTSTTVLYPSYIGLHVYDSISFPSCTQKVREQLKFDQFVDQAGLASRSRYCQNAFVCLRLSDIWNSCKMSAGQLSLCVCQFYLKIHTWIAISLAAKCAGILSGGTSSTNISFPYCRFNKVER